MLDRRTNIFDDDAPTSTADLPAAVLDQPAEDHAQDVQPVFADADAETTEVARVDTTVPPVVDDEQPDQGLEPAEDAVAAERAGPADDEREGREDDDLEALFDTPLANEGRRASRRAPAKRKNAAARRPKASSLPSLPRPSLRMPESRIARGALGFAATLLALLALSGVAAVFMGGGDAAPAPKPGAKAQPRPALSAAIFRHPGPPPLPARPYQTPEERLRAEMRKLRSRLASERADRRAARRRLRQLERRQRRESARRSAPAQRATAPTAPSYRPPSTSRPAPRGRRSGGPAAGAEFTVEG